MSVKVTNWVWHDASTQHLRGNAFTALLALADIADDDGHVVYAKGAKRTQEALAKKARMSVATFRRVTNELAAQGLLDVNRVSQRTENEYRVTMTAQSERPETGTAQSERSQMSGQSAQIERSERSPGERSSASTPSIGRSDVDDVLLSPDESDDAVLIPSEWRPNRTHVDKAASLRLDVKNEYQRFRDHAVRTHRRLKNWNAGFTNWLRKSAEMNQQRLSAPLASARPAPLDRIRGAYDAGQRVQDAIDRKELVG